MKDLSNMSCGVGMKQVAGGSDVGYYHPPQTRFLFFFYLNISILTKNKKNKERTSHQVMMSSQTKYWLTIHKYKVLTFNKKKKKCVSEWSIKHSTSFFVVFFLN